MDHYGFLWNLHHGLLIQWRKRFWIQLNTPVDLIKKNYFCESIYFFGALIMAIKIVPLFPISACTRQSVGRDQSTFAKLAWLFLIFTEKQYYSQVEQDEFEFFWLTIKKKVNPMTAIWQSVSWTQSGVLPSYSNQRLDRDLPLPTDQFWIKSLGDFKFPLEINLCVMGKVIPTLHRSRWKYHRP